MEDLLDTSPYYWKCRDCGKEWNPGQTGIVNEPDSGWYPHEILTGHTVDPINGIRKE